MASQNGRGGSYTLQGNYASYYYNAGVSDEDVNVNTVTISLLTKGGITWKKQ